MMNWYWEWKWSIVLTLKDGGQGLILISLGFMSGIVTISRDSMFQSGAVDWNELTAWRNAAWVLAYNERGNTKNCNLDLLSYTWLLLLTEIKIYILI